MVAAGSAMRPVERQRVRMVLSLCFAAALFEGADAVTLGLAAPSLAPVIHMRTTQLGSAISLTTLGLLIGATLGGRLSDRIGRRKVVISSMLTLGLSSFATIPIASVNALFVLRFITGLGLGCLLPTLIAVASEVARKEQGTAKVGAMFCGVPLGACLLGFVAAGCDLQWQGIFAVGGVGPLLLVPVLFAFLPETIPSITRGNADGAQPRESLLAALFAQSRAGTTLLLWLAAFFTSAAIWILVGWFPSLMVARGFSRLEATHLAALENLGAAAGSVAISRCYDVGRPWVVLVVTYAAMSALLMSLVHASGFTQTAAAGTACGFFVTGGQLLLYAMIPRYYPPTARGTGVGAAVSVGRLGSISGPALVGLLLGAGFGAAAVFLAMMPGLIVAGAALTLLAVTKSRREQNPLAG